MRGCQRNEVLEQAADAVGADASAGLVYADWLEEHGEPVAAEGYRVLSGIAGDSPSPLALALGSVSISAAVWAFVAMGRPALDAVELASDEHDRLNAVLLELGDRRAALARASCGRGPCPEAFVPSALPTTLPKGWPSLPAWEALHRALSRFRDALVDKSDERALLDAIELSREHDPTRAAERLARWALWSSAATGKRPLECDETLADSLAEEFEDKDLSFKLPLPGTCRPFSFRRVMVTHATQGIGGAVWMPGTTSRPGPRAVFAAMAADAEHEPDTCNAMDLDDRREWFDDDVVAGEREWRALNHLDAMEWLYECLASNQGEGVVVRRGRRKPIPLLDALEPLGVFVRGAMSEGDFPYTLLELENAWLFSHLIY